MLFYYAAFCLLYLGANGVSALRCYRTVSAQALGQDLGTHQEMHCEENSVCMLAEVHLRIDYTAATVFTGFCFPAYEVDTTACKDVLANMGEINAVGPGNRRLDSCKISFCSSDLCNDMNGPSLPEHSPSATAVGDTVECHAIQKTTTSLGSGNTNQMAKVSCRAGASCYLSKVKASARTTYRNFDIDVTQGGCKLASLCDYNECDWMQGDIEGMIPSSVQVDVTVKHCVSACCNGSLCNDINADIFGGADDWDSGISVTAMVAIVAVVFIVIVAIVVIAFVACRRSKQVPFTAGAADKGVKT